MAWSLVASSGGQNASATSPYTITLGAACLINDRVIVSATVCAGTPWSAATSGSTTTANELLIGAYGDDGEFVTPAPGSGFTNDAATPSNGSGTAMLESKDSGASGATKTADGTAGSSAGWVVCVAVYKLTAAVSASRPMFRGS